MSLRRAAILLTSLTAVVSACVMIVIYTFVLNLHASVRNIPILAITVIGLTVVAIVIGYRFMQPIRRRLYAIEEAAALMAAGRLQHRVAVMGNDEDEIEQLARQFNQMGGQIEQQVRMLQTLAEENERLAADGRRAAALEERQHLSRELHDSVSQQLFAMGMLAAASRRQAQAGSSEVSATLERLERLAEAAQREMRALLLHLRPVELDGRALDEAVQALLEGITERHQLPITLHYEVDVKLNEAIEQQLFRILQEALANVLKHAQAGHVQVSIVRVGTAVQLTVADDGVGLGETDEGRDAYGLRSMRERAEALGGTFDLWQRQQGTAVRVQIPVFAGEDVSE